MDTYDFLLTPKDIEVRDKTRKFIKEKVPPSLLKQMDADEVQYPREYVVNLAKEGLLGLRFDPKWGGKGLGWTAEIAALEEVGVLGMALGCLYSLPSICGEALYVFGNDDQRERYLRPTLEGKKFTAEALTEPRGGSDFFGATTKAVKDGDDWLLTGQKRFVVGAEGADYFILYARTGDSSTPSKDAITLFIVDKDRGVETKYLYKLLGTRGGGAGRLVLNNVRVPKENVIGKVGDGGKIFYQMMIPERMTSAAGILGTARAALDVAAEYSTKRVQFGKHIMEYQGVSFKVADCITLLDAARSIVYTAARAIDTKQPSSMCRRLVSEAKRFATEKAWDIVNLAMQVCGGIGYTQVYPIEKLLRDARLSTIWTGTSEIMNLIIQHEFYRELGERRAKKEERDVELDSIEDKNEEKVFE
ncbi:MAG: acyl-CoA/acyl-ACP dehydrogenase [Candidatus Lokiarchaeota archaeon]|nr:acyl-CoA/acyl-ACP dehydrogenase [Candidatus Lokiarchaeota archaeon]